VRGCGGLSFEAVSYRISELTGRHCEDLCELSKAGCVATLRKEKGVKGGEEGGRVWRLRERLEGGNEEERKKKVEVFDIDGVGCRKIQCCETINVLQKCLKDKIR
jgi:hypothetical protein